MTADPDAIVALPDQPLPPHPLTNAPGTCRVTRSTGTIDWICIRPVHATEASIAAGNPQVDQHQFVRLHPWRPTTTSTGDTTT